MVLRLGLVALCCGFIGGGLSGSGDREQRVGALVLDCLRDLGAVAMASMVMRTPFEPEPSARRSSGTGIAESSLPLPSTAFAALEAARGFPWRRVLL
jgi:hypothetical protein